MPELFLIMKLDFLETFICPNIPNNNDFNTFNNNDFDVGGGDWDSDSLGDSW